MAYTVIRRHTFISSLILSSLIMIGIGVLSLIMVLQGQPVSLEILYQIYMKYRPVVWRIIFMIYMYPVSLYAAIKSWQYKYKDFRIVIYKTSHPGTKVSMDNVSS